MKKYFSFILLFLLSTALFSKDLKKVSLQLSWFDQFQFAGYYMAKEKGFYEEYGLDVEIRPFAFGINVSDEVNSKKVDFAVDRETLLLQKVAGKNVTVLYALFQESPLVLLSRKDSKIDTIKKFDDKKIMTTIDDAGEVSLKSMILSKGLKTEDLNFVKHTHNIMDLVNRKTDVISAYLSKSPYDLKKMGIEYNIFSPRDYGFDMYSDFLFTHDDYVKNDLSTVLAFKEASLKGWEYAYSHIEDTADFMHRNYNSQNISLEALVFEGEVLKELSYANTNKIGNIKPEKMQRIYDLYNVMGLTPKKINLKEFILYKDYSDILNFSSSEKRYILDKKELNMCILSNSRPFSYLEHGEYKGFISDYMNLIEQKTKLDLNKINISSLKDASDKIKDGSCEIVAFMQETKERSKYLNFTVPYMNSSLAMVTRNDSSFIEDISILEGNKIGIAKNYSYNKTLKQLYPNLTFVDVDDIDDGLKKVQSKELFAYIHLSYSLWNKIHLDDFDKLKISAKLDSTVPISIAVAKNENDLYSILNKTVKSIPKGEMDNFLKKWVNVEYKKEFDYELLWRITTLFILVLLAIFYRQIILKKSNEDLKKKVDEKTIELKAINANLEKRIKEEVESNLKKDRLLAKQSKMAAMGEMISNIAHHWRQPLSLISTGASGLKLQKSIYGKIDDDFMDKTLKSIVDTSVELSKTIDDFMHFFKPSHEKKLFSISNVIDRTLNIFDYNLHNEKIKIIKEIEDREISGYESELIQVLANLLTNSKEAFEYKDINEKIIFINTEYKDDYILIKVKDNAGGIPKAIIEKVFDPYFTTKHQYQGTGIGLYMCQEMVNKYMDGSIELKNIEFNYGDNIYKGALFTIKIKIK